MTGASAGYGEYTQLFFSQLDTSTCCFRGKEVWFEEEDIADAIEWLAAIAMACQAWVMTVLAHMALATATRTG